MEIARDLELAEAGAQEVAKLLLGDGRICIDRGGDLLAKAFIGDAVDGGFNYRRVLLRRVLNRPAADVLPARITRSLMRSTMKRKPSSSI